MSLLFSSFASFVPFFAFFFGVLVSRFALEELDGFRSHFRVAKMVIVFLALLLSFFPFSWLLASFVLVVFIASLWLLHSVWLLRCWLLVAFVVSLFSYQVSVVLGLVVVFMVVHGGFWQSSFLNLRSPSLFSSFFLRSFFRESWWLLLFPFFTVLSMVFGGVVIFSVSF